MLSSPQADLRSLSVVVPAYNETGRIAASLRAMGRYLAAADLEAEILVVDDGSTDGTAELARTVLDQTTVPHRVLTGRTNRGKGYSVREGALAAEKDWILVTDADLSTPMAEVEKLWAAAEAGDLDLVMGSRALPESRIGVHQSWMRSTMGRIFNLLVHRFTGLPMRDTQCGFKLWRNRPLQPVLSRLQVDGFAWDVELLVAARSIGLKMAEVPVAWNDMPGSRVGMMSDSLRMFRDLIRIRLRR